MKILAWQKSGSVFRFVYTMPSGDLNVASVENYVGFESFLFYSDAIRLDGAIDIWQYRDKSRLYEQPVMDEMPQWVQKMY